jgi:hypothetical protein
MVDPPRRGVLSLCSGCFLNGGIWWGSKESNFSAFLTVFWFPKFGKRRWGISVTDSSHDFACAGCSGTGDAIIVAHSKARSIVRRNCCSGHHAARDKHYKRTRLHFTHTESVVAQVKWVKVGGWW